MIWSLQKRFRQKRDQKKSCSFRIKYLDFRISPQCDDNKGIYNNGQWYTYVTTNTFDGNHTLSNISTTEFEHWTNVIAIPLIEKNDTDNQLYAFVTETWLCRSCNGNMCLTNISSEIIINLNLV